MIDVVRSHHAIDPPRAILIPRMATNRSAESAEQTKHSHDKMFMENTLLRIAGALFCHDAKRAPTRTEEIVLNKGITEKNIVIRPDPRLGQPGPLAHKMFVALLKKHSDYGKPIRKEISFTRREIGPADRTQGVGWSGQRAARARVA